MPGTTNSEHFVRLQSVQRRLDKSVRMGACRGDDGFARLCCLRLKATSTDAIYAPDGTSRGQLGFGKVLVLKVGLVDDTSDRFVSNSNSNQHSDVVQQP